jgi:deoxycytidine triphosphate deaminase
MAKQAPPTTLFPSDSSAGCLSNSEIKELVTTNHLISPNTFSNESLKSSSYDIRVGNHGVIGGDGNPIDLTSQTMVLEPGAYAGVVSLEKFKMPNHLFGRIGSKRTLAYDGLILLTGNLIDPGYEGHLLFGLYNSSQKRVIIRAKKKLCSVTIERLTKVPENVEPFSDDYLINGKIPSDFLDKMANMEVLTWAAINDRVKQIEHITKDIIDLKARYEDVLKPIKDLTDNVKTLSKDVEILANQGKNIANDMDEVSEIVKNNNNQITQLTTTMQMISGKVSEIDRDSKENRDSISDIKTDVGRYRILSYIFWAVFLLIAGALISIWLQRIF